MQKRKGFLASKNKHLPKLYLTSEFFQFSKIFFSIFLCFFTNFWCLPMKKSDTFSLEATFSTYLLQQQAAAARYMTRFAKCNFDIRNFFAFFFSFSYASPEYFYFQFQDGINHLICCGKWRRAVQSLKAQNEGVRQQTTRQCSSDL